MAQKELTHTDITEITWGIMDTFEDFLEEKGVFLPDEDRESTTLEEAKELGEAILYGANYDELRTNIYDLLEHELLNEQPHKDEFGGEHEEGLGWNPDGDFCGECSNITCVGCKSSNRPLAIKILK